MSDVVNILNPMADSDRFPSLVSLQAAHSELLKRHRARGNKPEILAEIKKLMLKGQTTGVLLDSEDDRWAAQSLLDYWSSLLYRAGREVPDVTLAEFDPSLVPELDDNLCPYLGLEAFREENQHLFFGRQRLLNKLLEKLEHSNLLTVVGSSGSGKSSVVLGGLIPKLKAGGLPGSENWHYYRPMVPGSKPLEALAGIIRPQNIDTNEWKEKQANGFRSDTAHLSKLMCELHHQTSVVLVIDQFEELFTLCQDNEVRQAFVNNLLELVRLPDIRHTVILTMRTDFEDRITRLKDFREVFEEAQVRVTALDAGELRDAIEKPAELIDLKFENGLTEELLKDVLGEPAALPLLQFALLKLWESRERNRVTLETYRQVGGGRVSLAKSADEFYTSLIPENQQTAKRILLKMVRPTDGSEMTGNRILKSDLYCSGEASDRVDRVLEQLVESRLIRCIEGDSPEDTQVEIIHEALIRNWDRLNGWLDDKKQYLRQRRRLNDDVNLWLSRNRKKEFLYRGEQIKEIEKERYNDLTTDEKEFIDKSIEEQVRQRKEQEALALVSTYVQDGSLSGRFNVSAGEGSDIHIGDHYTGITINQIRTIIQELKELRSNADESDRLSLDSNILEIVNLRDAINLRLEIIEELYKNGYLSDSQKHELKEFNQALQPIVEQFSRLIKEVAATMRLQLDSFKLAGTELTGLQLDSFKLAGTELTGAAQASVLEFAHRLEDSRLGADWVTKNMEMLIRKACKEMFKQFSDLNASESEIDGFKLSLKQFLEQVGFSLYWGTYEILDSPEIPLALGIKQYEIAFQSMKGAISPRLHNETIQAIEECLDYLIERLRFY